MNKYLKLFVPGLAAIALYGAPAFAQGQPGQNQQPRQEMLQKLNLSDSQKADMKRIREKAKNDIRALLDRDQQAKFDAAQQQKPTERGWMRSLNLRPDQKTAIRDIMKKSREDAKNILTPEQRQQMEQFRQSHRRQKPM